MKEKEMKMVEVQWTDICGYGGWQKRDIDFAPLPIRSAGLLVSKGKDNLTICQSVGNDSGGHYGDVLCIPNANVRKVRYLK